MGSSYRLQTFCDVERKKELDTILGVSNDPSETGWGLFIDEGSPAFIRALPIFIELMEAHRTKLIDIGIPKEEFHFWYLYEYEHQCNMAFEPDITRRIGELGISLCISCWEK